MLEPIAQSLQAALVQSYQFVGAQHVAPLPENSMFAPEHLQAVG
jgi:hypothetical protein